MRKKNSTIPPTPEIDGNLWPLGWINHPVTRAQLGAEAQAREAAGQQGGRWFSQKTLSFARASSLAVWKLPECMQERSTWKCRLTLMLCRPGGHEETAYLAEVVTGPRDPAWEPLSRTHGCSQRPTHVPG